jgi:LmbE family N-acetylglucosaminyl deacetylase
MPAAHLRCRDLLPGDKLTGDKLPSLPYNCIRTARLFFGCDNRATTNDPMPTIKRLFVLALLLTVCTGSFAREPLSVDQGKSGLLLTLRKLRSTARLMHTAAHPDDEDGGMLTLESRGRGAMVVQMTLTRGEGGQNAVGKELGDELGMLRTLELLEADRYYGVDQRFSRVADFGFSKTAEETMQKWDAEHTALADLVRVIRTYRPEVVISRFIGDSSDGHGNHQASGILTREAFRAAGDANKFPEQIKEGLQPFQPKKLYVRAKGDDWNVELDVNQNDPVLGTSYVAWGWQGLKHQLSQGSANWQMPTRMWTSHYKLADTTLPKYKPGHEKDFFDGIDTTLVGLADVAPNAAALKPSLLELLTLIDEAASAADKDPKQAAIPLLHGFQHTREILDQLDKLNVTDDQKQTLRLALETKRDQFRDAANFALGATLTSSAELPMMKNARGLDPASALWLGASSAQTASIFGYSRNPDLKLLRTKLRGPEGVEIMGPSVDRRGSDTAFTYLMRPGPKTPYTRQYWHRDDPDRESIYHIDDPRYATLPLTPDPFTMTAIYEYHDLEGEFQAVPQVGIPKPHPLIVAPLWSIGIPNLTLVLPIRPNSTATLTITARPNAWKPNQQSPLQVRLKLPEGLQQQDPAKPSPFTVPARNGEVRIAKQVIVNGTTEQHGSIAALGSDPALQGQTFEAGYSVVTRDDLGAAYYFRQATQPVSIVDVNVPKELKVGYIVGVGDNIPDVLKSVGLDVTILSPEELKSGDLSKYSTIVLGIRAHEAREDVRQNNQRLLAYVKDGGTLMVQYVYQTDQFTEGKFAPYPLTLTRNNRDRVTVEEAPVEILAPNDPVFKSPNPISQKDFEGWVQERALYCPTQWDSRYTPLLSSHDPGDPPEKGGLLVAKYGKGTYIFNSWAFFRQLPAGVPGAIRLYVNLLNAGH